MRVAILSFQSSTDVIGAKYIHAYLRERGYESYFLLQPHADEITDDAVYQFIREYQIGVVAISVMSNEYFRATQFAKKFKSLFPEIPLVFGGIHATIAPEECLEFGDIAIRGEGEETFLSVIQCLEQNTDFSELPGVCLKKDGNIQLNPLKPLEHDLDIFPFPGHLPDNMFVVHDSKVLSMNLKLFRMYARYNGIFPSITTTRGCPFSCSYCCNSAYKELYKKYPVRKRTVASVIDECVEEKNKHPYILGINITDDCFLSYNDKWIQEFSIEYKKRVGLPFFVRTTPRHVTEAKISMLKDAGVNIIFMGLQSGSERINKEVYKRNVTNEEFLKASEVIRKAGLSCHYDIILDNPYETEDDLLETLNVALSVKKPFILVFYSLCLYQGTEIHKRVKEDNINFEDPRIKSYAVLSPTLFNQLIRMVPTYPNSFVKYLVHHRKSGPVKAVIPFLNFLNVSLLEPISFLGALKHAYGTNIVKIFKVARSYLNRRMK